MSAIPVEILEQLPNLSENMKSQLQADQPEDLKLVNQALALYQQDLVNELKVEFSEITATVQDLTPYEVILDFSIFSLNSCSCEQEGPCAHQLAVFFEVYSEKASIFSWITEWKNQLNSLPSISARFQLQRASDLLNTTGELKRSYDDWMTTFEATYNQLMKKNQPFHAYLMGGLKRQYHSELKKRAPIEREWQPLYSLISSLFLFWKWNEKCLETDVSHDMVDRYYSYAFDSLNEEIKDAIDKMTVSTLPFAFDEFLERLKQDSGKLLIVHHAVEEYSLTAYQYLWTHLLKKETWRKEEFARLHTFIKDESFKLHNPFPFAIAHLHHLFLQDDIQKAVQLWENMDLRGFPYMIDWLEYFLNKKALDDVTPLVERFVHGLDDYLNELYGHYERSIFFRRAMEVIEFYCMLSNRDDFYEKALLSTLPISYSDYNEFLFDREDYEKWVDLQMYMNSQRELLYDEEVKFLLKKQPNVLIPLFHQAIQRAIDGKSRDQYRLAVRMMKKLKTIYKKAKQEHVWEHYLEELLVRTKRLRAFQEECKKGKLIHA